MNIIIFDRRYDAKAIERGVVSYFITNRIEGENIIVMTEKDEILQYISDSARCSGIFFLTASFDGNEYFGIEVANQIRKHNKFSHISFVSENEKALKRCLTGLIRPSQYLLKPIQNKELFALIHNIYNDNLIDTIRIQINGDSYFIRISKILYVEKFEKKIIFHGETDVLEAYGTLASIHKKCDGTMVYVNKGQLVNKNAIVRIEPNLNSLTLNNGETLYISRGMKKNFF